MQVTVHFSYVERDVIPPRCRVPRDVYHDDGVTTVEIREISSDVFPLAIRLEGRYRGASDMHWFDELLWEAWTPNISRWEGTRDEARADFMEWMMSDNTRGSFTYSYYTRDEQLAHIQEWAQTYILVDDYPYKKVDEPRYEIGTYGLGHNHGGTSVHITTYYNGNVHKSRYFRLDEPDKALALATEIATKRGDTNYLPVQIPAAEIFIPECIRCNPQVEAGEGSTFINRIEGIIENSESPMENAVLLMSPLYLEFLSKDKE